MGFQIFWSETEFLEPLLLHKIIFAGVSLLFLFCGVFVMQHPHPAPRSPVFGRANLWAGRCGEDW